MHSKTKQKYTFFWSGTGNKLFAFLETQQWLKIVERVVKRLGKNKDSVFFLFCFSLFLTSYRIVQSFDTYNHVSVSRILTVFNLTASGSKYFTPANMQPRTKTQNPLVCVFGIEKIRIRYLEEELFHKRYK